MEPVNDLDPGIQLAQRLGLFNREVLINGGAAVVLGVERETRTVRVALSDGVCHIGWRDWHNTMRSLA